MNILRLPNNVVYVWTPRTVAATVADALRGAFFSQQLSTPIYLPPDRNVINWKHLLPYAYDGMKVVSLIRDPVTRFRVARVRTGMSVAEGLATDDQNFARIFDVVRMNLPVTWYRYPEQLTDLYEVCGASPTLNVNFNDPTSLPIISSMNRQQVEDHYAPDIALFDHATYSKDPYVLPGPVQYGMPATERRSLLDVHVDSWLSSTDFTALLNKLHEKRDNGTIDSYPKLSSVFAWLKVVQVMSVVGNVEFPNAPYTAAEALSE